MPFSARQGFFSLSGEAPPPAGDTIWYDITGSEWTGNAINFTGGSVTTTALVVSEFSGNSNRYRSGVLHPNGNIYYAPRSSSDGMLEFDPVTKNTSYLTYGDLSLTTGSSSNAWFHSACLTESGNILCIPFHIDEIIQVDPVAGTAVSMTDTFSGQAKWSGGVLGQNGNVYCVPQNYNGVLEIDPVNDATTVHTYSISMSGSTKWWGGYRSPKDDRIYCAPLRFGSVLVIAPDGQSATTETYGQSFSTSINQHYGATGDLYGNVVFCKGDTGSTIVVNPDSNTSFTATTNTAFGGVTGADGNVYTVSKGTPGQKIDLSSGNATPTVSTFLADHLPFRMAATTALNGNIYISPDGDSSEMYEVDVSAYMGVDNMSNLILSPYFKTSKI